MQRGIFVSEEGNGKEYDNSKLIPYSYVRSQPKNFISPQDHKARSTGSYKTAHIYLIFHFITLNTYQLVSIPP